MHVQSYNMYTKLAHAPSKCKYQGSIYYKLHSDKNKQYIVNEESDLA